MNGDGKLQLLRNEMEPHNCDILGLSEMRWKGKGELNNGKVIWSGGEERATGEVGFLLNKKAKSAPIGYNQVDSRLIVARFAGQPMNISVIQVCAPTSSSPEEEIELFYNNLESSIESTPKKKRCESTNRRLERKSR